LPSNHLAAHSHACKTFGIFHCVSKFTFWYCGSLATLAKVSRGWPEYLRDRWLAGLCASGWIFIYFVSFQFTHAKVLIFCSALPGYYVNGTKTLTLVVVRIRVSLSVSVSLAAAVDVDVSVSLALRQLQCSFQCF